MFPFLKKKFRSGKPFFTCLIFPVFFIIFQFPFSLYNVFSIYLSLQRLSWYEYYNEYLLLSYHFEKLFKVSEIAWDTS